MHGGFTAMRSALPVNLHAFRPNFPIWTGVRADIDRITEIWRGCLAESGGPIPVRPRMGLADAMFAPVCTRFATYDVDLDSGLRGLSRPRAGAARDAGVDAKPSGSPSWFPSWR